MIAWVAFKHNGIEYDLSHIHPSSIQYVQPEKGGNPARVYKVDVCYSLHCFSKGKSLTEMNDPLLDYSDAKETRGFDFFRYDLSKQLPTIIKNLNLKKCMFTGRGNFFIIEVVTPSGTKEDYEVYFDVMRGKVPGVLHLLVQSAFVAAPENRNKRRATKKVALYIILANKLAGKLIKIPN